MEAIDIKKATQNDIVFLQNISRQTFFETYAAVNTEKNMRAYLEKDFSLDKLRAELNDKNSEFYFAMLTDNVIGYLKLNVGSSQTERQEGNGLEIERIYVLQKFHGKKVGQLLYEKAMQVARENDAACVWLGVWERNEKAIRFYEKNGFVAFDKHIFRLGDDEQIDIMMKLALKDE